jgi:ADP-heptose:LPS heptosyltransferase
VKILAIRFARLGDVILLLPALASLKSRCPDSELTLVTGHRCAPVARLCPAIDDVIAVDRVAMRDGPIWRAVRDMVCLVRDIRKRRFDVAVDFHSFRETNLLAWLSGARIRVGMKRYKAPYWGFCFNRPPVLEDKSLHVSEMFQKVAANVLGPRSAGIAEPPRNVLVPPALASPWRNMAQGAVVLYVDAPVPERIWPAERFAQVADFAIETWNARVIVISSPQGAALAGRVCEASRFPGRLLLMTDLELPQLTAVIASARLLISNDTGPMHIGPAVGVQTLGLFSVGYPEHFRPVGAADRFLRANPIDRIQVQEVIEAMAKMWATVDRDLQH